MADQVMSDFFDYYSHFSLKTPKIKLAHPVPNQLLLGIRFGRASTIVARPRIGTLFSNLFAWSMEWRGAAFERAETPALDSSQRECCLKSC